jgi:hypothetical protein
MLADRYGGCAWETFGSAGLPETGLAHLRTAATSFEVQSKGASSNFSGYSLCSRSLQIRLMAQQRWEARGKSASP